MARFVSLLFRAALRFVSNVYVWNSDTRRGMVLSDAVSPPSADLPVFSNADLSCGSIGVFVYCGTVVPRQVTYLCYVYVEAFPREGGLRGGHLTLGGQQL